MVQCIEKAYTMHTSTSATTARAYKCCCTHPNAHQHKQLRCQATAQELAQLAPHIETLQATHVGAAVSALPVLADVQAGITAVASAAEGPAAAVVPVNPSTYTPGPVEVGWQIWFAAVVSTIPFAIGAYEFGKRILIQRRCKVCGGSGLVQRGRFQRKCPECGGFFPWISWSMFLSANARPGNGGPLLQPRGQTSVFYTVPPAESQQDSSSSSRTQAGSKEDSSSEAAAAEASDKQPVAVQEQRQYDS